MKARALSRAQISLLRWLRYANHYGRILAPGEAPVARALVRRGLARMSGGRTFITKEGLAALRAERGDR